MNQMKLSKGKIGIALLFVVLFLFLLMLSSIVKYWVNKNSEQLIGRKIEISQLHFNYAKVSARVEGFTLYELDKKSSFISFDELYVNVNPWKLLSGEYSISEIYLDGLNVSVTNKFDKFNFDDLIEENASQQTDTLNVDKEKQDLKFSIQNIKFKNGHVNYFDFEKNNRLDLKDINLELPLIAWNDQKSEVGVHFSIGEKGNVSINADIDYSLERYTINLGVTSLDISPFVAYLEDYAKVSKMKGLLDTKLAINGSMNDFMDVFVKGDAALNQFSVYDSQEKLFLATKSADVVLDSLNLGTSHYEIGRISLDSTRAYVDLYTDASNFERILQPYLQTDTLEDALVETESETLFYSIDTLILRKGNLRFTDHTLNRKFVYDLSDINSNVGSISEEVSTIPVTYSMNLNGGGYSSGNISFSLKDLYQFSMKGKVEKLNLMSFSPYTEFYIARPITQGELKYSLSIDMNAFSLDNQNKVKISEFEFGEKTKDPNAIKAPVRLALYLLKDQNDQIQFDLPVSGHPKDPEFRFGKIVWKTCLNFLVKTASKPFGLLGNLTGTNPESIEKIPFDLLQDSLSMNQKKTLDMIASILKKKPQLKFIFSQETNFEEEKNLLAIQECAHRFFRATEKPENSISNDQLLKWANEDLDFKNYILSLDKTSVNESILSNCKRIIGEQMLTSLFENLIRIRNKSIENYLTNSLLIDEKAFEVQTADLRNLSIEQRSPKFRVEVSLQ
jgi:hypothetical protein